MPEISRFYGIIIRMYYNDHNPPHFHAIYGSQEAVVGITPIAVLWGDLPGRARSMALEWAALHQQELQANWQRLPRPRSLWPPWIEATMRPRITHVRPTGGYKLELNFSDGIRAEVDLRDDVLGRGGVLAPLEDVHFFGRVRVDPEASTLVWPNGVDMCPDVLYSRATGQRLPLPAEVAERA